MRYVGIDLAGSPLRPTGFCAIDQNMNAHCSILNLDGEILAAIRKSKTRFVAIDAPLALPKGRHCLEEHCRGRAHFRACDRALTRMRIRFFPITIGPMRMLTKRGMRVAKSIRRLGISAVETVPGAAQDPGEELRHQTHLHPGPGPEGHPGVIAGNGFRYRGASGMRPSCLGGHAGPPLSKPGRKAGPGAQPQKKLGYRGGCGLLI